MPTPWMLIAGTLCTDRCFDPMLIAMGDSCPDRAEVFQPGLKSDPNLDTLELLDQAPERFVICAFSLGGILAFQAALRAPDRVAGMVLISVTGQPDPAEKAIARRQHVELAKQIGLDRLIRDYLWPNYVAKNARDNKQLRVLIEEMALEVGIEQFANQTEIAIARADIRLETARLKMPILFLNGDEDISTPPERAAELCAHLAKAHHRIFDNAGHCVLLERPNSCANAIEGWLSSNNLNKNQPNIDVI
jgi:pimeloyl-ACP methyl ester carboxylesterase